MAPEDKLRLPDEDDNDGPVDTNAEPLSESEYKRIHKLACECSQCLCSLLKADLDNEDRRQVDCLVGQIIDLRRDCGFPHRDEVQRMTAVMRDSCDLMLLSNRALDGDFEAQVALQRAASTTRKARPARLTDIERRRAQLLEVLEQFQTVSRAIRPEATNSAYNVLVEMYGREARECDPLWKGDSATIENALRHVHESDNTLTRTAAKFTYAIDMYDDRSDFRCTACFKTTHACADCKRRVPDPISSIEARFRTPLALLRG